MNMDRQQVTLLVLLDLSAAFDTVDHRIILHRMETSFGITGTVLEWFRSYLTNRSQRVVFGEGQSKSFQLPYGVPQGSCLGPLMFTVYSSKLFDIICGCQVDFLYSTVWTYNSSVAYITLASN